jgi:hypothetical protein
VVRNYKRKPGRVNPDRRMAAAAELRAQGLSLRQIGTELLCSEITVRRDLARWEALGNVLTLRHSPATFSPQWGANVATDVAGAESKVISLSDRRKHA